VAQFIAKRGAAAALPGDRGVDWLTALAIPADRGLALVADG